MAQHGSALIAGVGAAGARRFLGRVFFLQNMEKARHFPLFKTGQARR